MKTFCVIGAGQRGMDIYANYIKADKDSQVIAVVEPNDYRRNQMMTCHDIPISRLYKHYNDFFAEGKICDGIILATMDFDHFEPAMKALELGYDILLEKPISPSPAECVALEEKANELGRTITVCHVLRYTNFFGKIKEIIDSGRLGKIVSIRHDENVGNFHMAHSFVRGNFRNTQVSSPMILQKSCHDMDLLLWLVGSHVSEVHSFGALSYFTAENAPVGSSERCSNCSAKETCRFHAMKVYKPVLGSWPTSAVCDEQTLEALTKALEEGPYGKCVYKTDNNVCDHQTANLLFENGVTATFQLSGFTNKMNRTIRIMFEDGELFGNDSENRIEIRTFASNQVDEEKVEIIYPETMDGFHGGGDSGLMKDFLSSFGQESREAKTSINHSVESHLMAFACEYSRLNSISVSMSAFREKIKMDKDVIR